MVDTASVNGDTRQELPDLVRIDALDQRKIPSPGTMRAIKAETGRSWDELVGEHADTADRFQTMIWIKLRREIPDLRWDDCAEIEIEIDEGTVAAALDPTRLAGSPGSDSSPASVGSGG